MPSKMDYLRKRMFGRNSGVAVRARVRACVCVSLLAMNVGVLGLGKPQAKEMV